MYGGAKPTAIVSTVLRTRKTEGTVEAVGSDIDLGRARRQADRQQFLMLRLGSSPWGSSR
jgi:hypothetical protein